MGNHFLVQRSKNVRLFALQLLLAGLIGAIWSLFGSSAQGLAFAIAAMSVAIGGLLQSLLAFSGGVQPAGVWFGRFVMALFLKWLAVFLLLLLFMRWLAKAPFAAIVGFAVSLLVIQLFNFFDAKVTRGR